MAQQVHGFGADRVCGTAQIHLRIFTRKQAILDVHDPVGKSEQPRIVRDHKNGASSLFGNAR
jgi:hypothetical protein